MADVRAVAALVCAAAMGVLVRARAQAAESEGPLARVAPVVLKENGATAFAYPPRDMSLARPAVVFMHGMCGVASNGCPHFREGSAGFGWLVCPQANAPCPGGGASWGGSTETRGAVVDAAVAAVARAHPGAVDEAAPTVLVGFSQGAWTAVDLVKKRRGRYTGLFLIGAPVEATDADLREAGVARLVLAAGRYDPAYAPMNQLAKRLAQGGFDARFVSLGRVGHTYAAEDPSVVTASVTWLTKGADSPVR